MDRPSLNAGPAARSLLAIVAGLVYLTGAVSPRQAMLFLVGAVAGVVLYRAAFGYTSSWRAFATRGEGAGSNAATTVPAGCTDAALMRLLIVGC
jgi:hypothetical protein